MTVHLFPYKLWNVLIRGRVEIRLEVVIFYFIFFVTEKMYSLADLSPRCEQICFSALLE